MKPAPESPDRACLGRGDVMHAPPGEDNRQRAVRTGHALQLCNGCVDLEVCRAWVLDQDVDPCPWSVVGALLPGERRAARCGMPLPPVPRLVEVAR